MGQGSLVAIRMGATQREHSTCFSNHLNCYNAPMQKFKFSVLALALPIGLPALLLNSCNQAAVSKTPPAKQSQQAQAHPNKDTSNKEQTLRFVAFGDMGTGSRSQYEVAKAVQQKCQKSGCDFVLTLGDNIYNNGVSSVSDSQFQSKFEKPYAALPYRFYMVLGNHDYRGNVEAQVAYTQKSKKWYLPKRYYDFQAGPVTFLALDTNQPNAEQTGYFQKRMQSVQTPWTIAFGHHPRYTNSFYHNSQSPALRSMLDNLCGHAQVYLSGHEHDKQHLKSRCGTEYLIVGTGAGLRPVGKGSDTHFARSSYGFAWFEVSPRKLYFEILDSKGQVEYRASQLKDPEKNR
jgi:tartrate-resistant acid phosphatase type 5